MWFLRLPVNRLLRAITPAKARSPGTTLTQLTPMHAPNTRSQGGSSIDFAGTGQRSDSNSTTRVGPLTRPRNQRNTSSGSSGLNVRIIPAPGSPTNSTSNGTGTGPLSDRDTDDASQSNQPSANSSGSQTTKRANANSSPSGG